MNRFREGHKFWVSIPPWLILGAVAILAPVLIFMALQGIKMQKELAEQLLIEQGDALIRSFEAGARTGAGLKWGDFQLQKLLIETAQQPGIDYLIVTDRKGVILADSDPSQVDQTYEAGPQEAPSRKIQWRTVAKPNGGDTFEVYRLINLPDNGKGPVWVIFVGLDMDPCQGRSEPEYEERDGYGPDFAADSFCGDHNPVSGPELPFRTIHPLQD